MREPVPAFDIIFMMSRASQDRPAVVTAPAGCEGLHEDVSCSTIGSESTSSSPWKASNSIADLPLWVGLMLDDGAEDAAAICRHRSVRVEGAASMPPAEFEERTRDAYRRLLDGVDVDRLWRAWNFIPRINDDATQCELVRDRYMSFNAGRHRGFSDVHGSQVRYPVASGVGHEGDDLVVHLLHGDRPARIVDNPRQIRPDDYSLRFGDPPPAFARACRLELPNVEALLISGTASVVGEDSVHDDDFAAQLEETILNLRTIVELAWPGQDLSAIDDWLVYLPDARFAGRVRDRLSACFPKTNPMVQIREQRLCRPELLVEIECASFRRRGEDES